MTGIRQRKKAERREQILACGSRLFTDHGFDATTMEAIASCADISPATLYNFFPTKLDILTEVFGRQIDARLGAARREPSRHRGSVVDAVHDLLATLFNTFAGFDRGLLRRVTLNALNEGPARDAGARYVMAEEEMIREVASLLLTRQLSGDLPPDLAIADIARAVFASGNGEYYAWLGDDDAKIEDVLARVRRHIEIILAPTLASAQEGPRGCPV